MLLKEKVAKNSLPKMSQIKSIRPNKVNRRARGMFNFSAKHQEDKAMKQLTATNK